MGSPAIQVVRSLRYSSLRDDVAPVLDNSHQPTPPELLHDFLTIISTHDPDTVKLCSQLEIAPDEVTKLVIWNDVCLATSSEPNTCRLIEMI